MPATTATAATVETTRMMSACQSCPRRNGNGVFFGNWNVVNASRKTTSPAMPYWISRAMTGVGPSGSPVVSTKTPKSTSTTAETTRSSATFIRIMIRRATEARKQTASATPDAMTLTWKTGGRRCT